MDKKVSRDVVSKQGLLETLVGHMSGVTHRYIHIIVNIIVGSVGST